MPKVRVKTTPEATPLYARIEKEGRLVRGGTTAAATVASTNIQPITMSMAETTGGMSWLLNKVFSPELFLVRVENFVSKCGVRGASERRPFFTGILVPLARKLASYGEGEVRLLKVMERAAKERPDLQGLLSTILIYYCQARHMLEDQAIWDPNLAQLPAPAAH